MIPGVRLEQVILYATGLLMALLAGGLCFGVHARIVVGAWALLVLLAIVVAAFGTPQVGQFEQISALAGLDNLLTPVVGIAVGTAAAHLLGADRVFAIVRAALVCALVANAGLAAAQALGVPALASLDIFWGANEGDSVASLALTNSRYTGVFNQPLEAGLAYGVALIALAIEPPRNRFLSVISLTGILAGGLLGSSKLFILALALVLIFLIMGLVKGRRLAAVVSIGVVAWLLLRMGFVSSATSGLLTRLTAVSGDPLASITAGRYSSTGAGSLDAVSSLLNDYPFFGLGIRGVALPYDSQWVEARVYLGYFGAILIAVILVVLAHSSLRMPIGHKRSFALLLVAFLLVASIGAPSLTANRVASWLWIIIGAVILFSVDKDCRTDRLP